MLGRDAHHYSESLEIEDDIESTFVIFENLGAFIDERVDFKNLLFKFVHVAEEAFDECSKFFSSWNNVASIHDYNPYPLKSDLYIMKQSRCIYNRMNFSIYYQITYFI